MEQLTPRVEIETGLRGANHGIVTTSEGLVMIDTPYKPTDALRLRDELSSRPPLRYIVNTEPHPDHWTGNAFFEAPVIAHAGVRDRILGIDPAELRTRIAGLGADQEPYVNGYRPRAPEITFSSELTLHLGDQTLRLLHMPGHTRFQAAVLLVEQRIVFTSDNVFSGVHVWLQEADPAVLLRTIDALRALPADILVPGHGKPCDKAALDELEAFIREWVEYVRDAVERGWPKERCVAELTAMRDRYPMDVGQAGMAPRVMQMNVANLYDYLTGAGIHARP